MSPAVPTGGVGRKPKSKNVPSRVECIVCATCGMLAAVFLLTACTTSHRWLTVFFDGVPAPGEEKPLPPVKKPPRRLPYKPPEPLVKRVEDVDLPPPVDWRGRYQMLTRNAAGDIEWIRALTEKTITPRPGLAADAKDEEPSDIDVELVPKGQPNFKVVFAHKPHTQWLGCPNCHTGIFEMEKGKAGMTMEKINGGAYCGVCHSTVASPNLTNCAACHKSM